jgi:hypothetical protein
MKLNATMTGGAHVTREPMPGQAAGCLLLIKNYKNDNIV